ncbi:LacI family DNA-binding transcriptional regulator [Fodinisporobacter ferrooxydans]|uniref:LacI family DNA-binding transcriptional regulator n=1 Tax=Fodinisporobacter ferrooxydans TaxID=2901836 RepID=A0ABY4CLG5_9BACL|nr:LacI family DNA-binding transcriptional regulator [Alicyclobacillaceae bacterium MYW30-H2]
MTTIKEIAEKANVSMSTVSKVLNNRTNSISEETRNRIFEIAEQFQYKSNRKQTNKQLNKEIGILTWCSQQDESNDPYFLSIRQGIEKQCNDLGIRLSKMIRMSDSMPNYKENQLDGLIVIGKIDLDDLKKTFDREDRIVFVNQSPASLTFDSVVADFETATQQVLDHFLRLGHTRIGYIGGEEYLQKYEEKRGEKAAEIRKETFENILKNKGYYNPKDVYIGEWTTASGYELMKQALRDSEFLRAFFVASDNLAIGAIRALHESGFKVPDDVAIVSCDDIEIAAYVNPPLSTVRVHTEQMGKSAVNVLNERMNGRDIPVKVVIPTELIIRESCGSKLT